jgi:phosphoserine phosphatase RsbU/P
MSLSSGVLRESDRLALLYRVSQTFNSTLDLDEVLNSVLDEVITSTRAERGFLMLVDDHTSKLRFQAARGLDQHTIDDPQSQVSLGVIDRVFSEGRPLLTSNAQSDDWLSERKSVMMLGLRSVLCVPLQRKGQITGIIYVDNRVQSGIFTSDDLDLLTSIAASAVVAIENARLYQLAVERGRIERELQLARQVQASLLPTELPQVPGWEFASRWEPAYEVAGDFYDLRERSTHEICAVVADVSDKGLGASFFMALTRTILRASVLPTSTLAEGISQANRLISADSTQGMFVTLFYGLLNPSSGELCYVNGGHNPPLFYQSKDSSLLQLTRTGMALGVEEEAVYEQRSIMLQPGDFVLFYTDGLTEAFDKAYQQFGEERLERLLIENYTLSAAELVEKIVVAVREFSGMTTPSDDLTLIVVRRND